MSLRDRIGIDLGRKLPVEEGIEKVFGDGFVGQVLEKGAEVIGKPLDREVDEFIAGVAAQERAHGVRFCAQIVAE